MKRHGNLFAAVCEWENLKLAWRNAQRGKSGKEDRQVKRERLGSQSHFARAAIVVVDMVVAIDMEVVRPQVEPGRSQ